MKKINISIVAVAVCLFALAGCENDGFYYQDVPRARLEGPSMWTLGAGADSMSYNFVYGGIDATQYDVEMKVVVMGETADRDRTVNLEIIADRTTASASQYIIPATVTVPAGEYETTFNVTLKRTADLEQKAVRLRFGVAASDDFQPGTTEDASFLIIWNDMVGKPLYWDDELNNFFGTYSDAKFRFMIDVLGTSDFEGLNWSQKFNMNVKLQAALLEYNAANGVLLDEDLNPVTFPESF